MGRDARKSFKRRKEFSFSKVMLVISLLFLLLPLVLIIVYSFNKDKGAQFTGFSLQWYKELFFDSPALWKAVLNSIIIALSSAAVSTVLATLAAVGVSRYRFAGRRFIQTVSYLPMVMPEVIIGVSTVLFFAKIGLQLGLFTIFLAHVTFCLPFVFLTIMTRLDEFDVSVIEAAKDLGADERTTLLKIVIPIIMPGILSGYLMAVTLSMEDFVITFFVSGPGSTTLPLYIYSLIRFGITPAVNALALFILLSICLVVFTLRKFLKTLASSR
jgi:spermidine/putrescine transport system permease protein